MSTRDNLQYFGILTARRVRLNNVPFSEVSFDGWYTVITTILTRSNRSLVVSEHYVYRGGNEEAEVAVIPADSTFILEVEWET